MKEIDGLLEHFLVLKKSIEILQEKQDLVKTKLKIYMEEADLEKFEDTSGNFALYKKVTRKSLDRKMVEQHMAPAVFDRCFKETSFSSLTVVAKEDVERRKNFIEKSQEEE